MKHAIPFLILLLILAGSAFAQPKPAKRPATVKPTPTPQNPALEKEELEKAIALESALERAEALKSFLDKYPKATFSTRARELLVRARAEAADEKFKAGEIEAGKALFKNAVLEAPQPLSGKLFSDVISKFPANLFWRGERVAAFEIAKSIEEKVEQTTPHYIDLATFHISVENGDDAVRLAGKAVELDPKSSIAQQTLGLALRLNFALEDSARAYVKAVELDAESIPSKRNLAEMLRATGKFDDAIALYREILVKNESDLPSRTGVILSLFDAGKKTEAESEMTKALEQKPDNLTLLAGVAYWHAANGNADKAIEFAEKAIAIEPRYVWPHLALGRALLIQKKPLEAEKALAIAKRFGNFPTLEFELASARLMAGFYREAAEDLIRTFAVEDGVIKTKLGGRVAKGNKNFSDLLAPERAASIFEPHFARDAATDAELKSLLEFYQRVNAAEINETEIIKAADAFLAPDDKMKVHRQLFAASILLGKRTASAKALELARSATGNFDNGLDVIAPAAAVLASELYESRKVADERNEFVLVPDVPRQTLSAILRGRIEELAGAALLQQNNATEAVIRLKRAISVLPENSAWWRSSMWRLGSAYEINGREKEALDAYIKSYVTDKPSPVRYAVIESLYKKVHGNVDGLEAKIGQNPLPPAPAEKKVVEETVAQKIEIVEPKSEPSPAPDEPPPTPEGTPAVSSAPESLPVPTPQKETPEEAKPKAVTVPAAAEPTLKAEPTSSPIPEPAASEKKTEIAKPENPVPDTQPSPAPEKSKPLFEPIIITIPNSTPAKSSEKQKDPPSAETEKEVPTEEAKENLPAGEVRPRVVAEADFDRPECRVLLSNEHITLLNGGGGLGILVGLIGKGNLKELVAASSSAADVEVKLEPEITGISGRTFYLVKSISTKTGEYIVNFELPCGKKELKVTVH